MSKRNVKFLLSTVLVSGVVLQIVAGQAMASPLPAFIAGDLVVSVEGNGDGSASGGTAATGNTGASANSYLDNQAAPLSLYEFKTTGANQTAVSKMTLPTTSSGANSAFSGEYGSSSEAQLSLSGDGKYLSIAGYAVNPAAYNAAHDLNGTGTALAQSCSLSSGCGGTPQTARVIATIDGNKQVDTSTVLYNVFNTNNPRSVYSPDGKSFYISGQGSGNAGDATGGVFYVPGLGPNQTAVAITGLDATSTATSPKDVAQDTRTVQIYNNTLYVSADTKQGKNSAKDFVGSLGTPPATSLYNSGNGPTQLTGIGTSATGKITITTGANTNGNQFNNTTASSKNKINLSPAGFFFANAYTLYIADTGSPKNDSNGDTSTSSTNIGDGGLQKWINSATDGTGTWSLAYTLTAGLNDFVQNNAASGTTGLLGLTGLVVGNAVELFATNYTIGDTDQTYLYGITDLLAYGTASDAATESFITLATADAGTNFKGVAFAPTATAVSETPLPGALPLFATVLGAGGLAGWRRKRQAARAAA